MRTRCLGTALGRSEARSPRTVRPAACRAGRNLSSADRFPARPGAAEMRWRPGTSHRSECRGRAVTGLAHAAGLGAASWPDSSPRAGTLDQADLRAARGRAGLAGAELTGGSSWTAHRGAQRGSWQTACRHLPLALTSDRGPPRHLHHEAEFAKCLLLNISCSLAQEGTITTPIFG